MIKLACYIIDLKYLIKGLWLCLCQYALCSAVSIIKCHNSHKHNQSPWTSGWHIYVDNMLCMLYLQCMVRVWSHSMVLLVFRPDIDGNVVCQMFWWVNIFDNKVSTSSSWFYSTWNMITSREKFQIWCLLHCSVTTNKTISHEHYSTTHKYKTAMMASN